jgi:hypothetical protein
MKAIVIGGSGATGKYLVRRLLADDRLMRTTISVFAFLSITLLTFGQEQLTFLKNWNTYSIPDNILRYNGAQNDWVVYLDKNEIRVIDDRSYTYKKNLSNKKLPFRIEQSGLSDVIKVKDGYLVAFNKGEWGGSLYWYSKNGKKNNKIGGSAFSTAPIQFIKRDNQIYAITGTSHMSLSYGNIIKIDKKQEQWIIEEYIELPDAPRAIQLDNKNNMLVFTSSGLYSIDKKANLDTLAIKLRHPITPVIEIELPNDTLRVVKKPMEIHPKWVWGFLYPTSMVIQNNVVYVGMRGGVYKFDLTTKKEEWLLPE